MECDRPSGSRVAAREGSISPVSLLAGEVEEKHHRILFPLEMVDHGLTLCTDTTPTPYQAGLTEQVRLDRHRIEAGHVFCPVGSFNIELVGLRDHDGRIAFSDVIVQRQL